MSSDRRAILQLLALGHINPAQAERLLAIAAADRDAVWTLVGCAAIAAVAQLHSVVPVVHLFRSMLVASLPALQHAFTSIATSFGGWS